MPQALVELQAVSKTFTEGGRERSVLAGVDVTFHEGEFAVILGKSGSGKSTLLNVISGVDEPDQGTIRIRGQQVTGLRERERTLFRRDHLGIIFQFFNLIPTLTVQENIMLPYELRGASRKQGEARARALLEEVGLPDRAATFPDRLSGGEQQRVAIARALVHEPLLILADEPTGNLDGDTGTAVLELLLRLTREAGRTLLMVTHSMDVVPYADRVFRLRDGELDEVTTRAREGYALREAHPIR
ncbi:MAG: ABC transporter ATP-binding protein [Anaerolineae bacterium]|nr:ABC transporter ATP-binding protein [Anaerolineae bacterium]